MYALAGRIKYNQSLSTYLLSVPVRILYHCPSALSLSILYLLRTPSLLDLSHSLEQGGDHGLLLTQILLWLRLNQADELEGAAELVRGAHQVPHDGLLPHRHLHGPLPASAGQRDGTHQACVGEAEVRRRKDSVRYMDSRCLLTG